MPYTDPLIVTFKLQFLEVPTEPLDIQFTLTNGDIDKVQCFEVECDQKEVQFEREIKFDFASTIYNALVNWALLIQISYQNQVASRCNVLITTSDSSGKYKLNEDDSHYFTFEDLEERDPNEEFEEVNEDEYN